MLIVIIPNIANALKLYIKMIINAGIKEVIIRGATKNEFLVVNVEEWIKNDDLLNQTNIIFWGFIKRNLNGTDKNLYG